MEDLGLRNTSLDGLNKISTVFPEIQSTSSILNARNYYIPAMASAQFSRFALLTISPRALAIVLGALSHRVRMRNLCDNSGSTPCEGSLIQSRKARYNYGISISEPFVSGYHPNEKMATDMVTGMRICTGRMVWIIRKARLNKHPVPSFVIRIINKSYMCAL